MGKITFIIGGARSGKSRFAMKLADSYFLSIKGVHGGNFVSPMQKVEVSPMHKKVYIATAEPLDEEMKERIEKHKRERSLEWITIEEPLRIGETIRDARDRYDVILIDCLTLWLSNLLINNRDAEKEIEHFVSSLRDIQSSLFSSLFIVSNEVGAGIVPENALSRKFRDLAGYLNQKVAEVADEVYFVIAGIPLRIK